MPGDIYIHVAVMYQRGGSYIRLYVILAVQACLYVHIKSHNNTTTPYKVPIKKKNIKGLPM